MWAIRDAVLKSVSFPLRKRAGCFALIMLLLLCGCLCSIPLPHIAVDWYAVCDIPGHTHSVGKTVSESDQEILQTHCRPIHGILRKRNKVIGVAPITQATHVRNKIVTLKGGHLS